MALIDKRLLMLPGYVVGLGGLALITYRTLLAFGTSSKAVTIHVNRYGEQYVDLVLLGVLWVICLVGMWSLSCLLKEQRTNNTITQDRTKKKSVIDQDKPYDSFIQGMGAQISKTYAESIPQDDQGYVTMDAVEWSSGASVSVTVVQGQIEKS